MDLSRKLFYLKEDSLKFIKVKDRIVSFEQKRVILEK